MEEQRDFIVQKYFKNNENLTARFRKVCEKYGHNIDLTSKQNNRKRQSRFSS